MGGGIGFGFGIFFLKMFEDEFLEVYRFVIFIYFFGEDDVIILFYNSILVMKEFNEYVDCVLFIDN